MVQDRFNVLVIYVCVFFHIAHVLYLVTEDEIQRGIINAKDPKTQSYWFRRTITDLKEHIFDRAARNFIDKLGAENLDDEAVGFTEALKTTKIPSVLPAENVNCYDIQWAAEHGVDPKGVPDHQKYLDRLCDDFYRVLRKMIDDGIKERSGFFLLEFAALLGGCDGEKFIQFQNI